MKMRITITDKDDREVVSQHFEVASASDCRQAAEYVWNRLRETLADKAMASNQSTLELAQALDEHVQKALNDYKRKKEETTSRVSAG